MAYLFPTLDWFQALKEKLNSDEKYAKIARNWEGDIMFEIEGDFPIQGPSNYYLDLWHGKCRDAYTVEDDQLDTIKPDYTLSAPYDNFLRVIKGDLDPMQAMITRKLKVKGSMAYMMRNVPVVLDFVRCVKEIETEFVE